MEKVLKTQVGGTHYQGFVIPPVEFIMKNKLPFAVGNAVKYVVRAGKKNQDPREDLKKAIHYIEMMIAEYEEGLKDWEDDYDDLDRLKEEEEQSSTCACECSECGSNSSYHTCDVSTHGDSDYDILVKAWKNALGNYTKDGGAYEDGGLEKVGEQEEKSLEYYDDLAQKWLAMLGDDDDDAVGGSDTLMEYHEFYTEPCDGSDGCSCSSKEDVEEKKQQEEEAVKQSTDDDVDDDDIIKEANGRFIMSGGCETLRCSDCGYSEICDQVTSEYVEPIDASVGFKGMFTTVYTKIIDDTLKEVFQKSSSYVEFVGEMVKLLKSEHVFTDYQKQALDDYGLLPLYIALRAEKLEVLTEQEFLEDAEAAYAGAVPHVMDWVLCKLPYNKDCNYAAFVKSHNGMHHFMVNAVAYNNIETWNSHIPLGNMLFSVNQVIRDAIYLCGGDSLEVKVLLGLHLYSQIDRNDKLFNKLVDAMHNFMEIASQDIIAYLADDLKHSSSFLEWTIRIRATIYQNLGDIKVIIQEELECDRYNKMSVLLYNILVAQQLIGLADFFFAGRGFGKYLKWIVELNDLFSLKVYSGLGVSSSTGYATPYEYLKNLRALLWHHSHQWEETTGGQSYDNKAMAFMHLAIIDHIKHVSSVVLDFKESFAFNKEPYETPDGHIRVLDDAMFEVALMLRDANKYEVATNGF